jgi:hypothetical protein
MSPQLHYEIARGRQQEIAARAIRAHHALEVSGNGGRRHQLARRLSRGVAAFSVCVAVPIAVTAVGARANPSSMRYGGPVSASQYASETRALEANGYVPTSCTVRGTLMRDYLTGRSVTVTL